MSFFYNEGAVLCRSISSGSYLSSFLQNTLKSNQVEINTDSRTLRPVAKLREPRELFALPKELDCPQQAARWPAECQVLEERIQHIEYMPSTPEEYYQPTGREIQPKPVGEEAGTIVFQYYPMSAVNYFSRSSVGGSRFFLPSTSDQETDLRFESRFESGNLAKAVKITDTYYELSLRTDLYTNRHMQWFYFRVENTRKRLVYRFSIVNLTKAESLYCAGMKPLLYSTKDTVINGVGWRRCGDNITYFKNDPQNGEEDQYPSFTLSFNLEFPHDDDTVYLAQCYPYTYTDLQDYLIKLQNHPVKSEYSKLRLLCRSLAGNNVYYLTVTAPSPIDEPKKKRAIVITSRVHPGETPASWMMKGFMDFLTGDTQQARELREKFIFKLVPMLNPDGVIVGNNRCSLTGRDLNRQYRTVIRETYPPVWHTKLMIRRLMEECGIAMYCDLHAHSRKQNVFIYGCENKRFADKRLHEQVFPLMLHKNAADKFSFESCKFRIQRSKEGTGRVVVWMMGVANSYTMEASFGGSTLGGRCDTHFTTQDFEQMGRSFCETLLDFCDEDPSKERLRTKIIARLVKEGSSADEPTNIVLSDYSSDEGDTSSCSEEEGGPGDQDYCLTPSGPPPSPVLPHHRSAKAQRDYKEEGSRPIRAAVSLSPPVQRKILQIPRANLDLLDPGGSDVLEGTTEQDSADDSPTSRRRNRTLDSTSKGYYKYSEKANMPPELIVTPAQVYDYQQSLSDAGEKTKDSSSKAKHEDSPSLPRKGDNSWSPERARIYQAQKTSLSLRCELSHELQSRLLLQPSITLAQTIWTGVEYCTDCTKNVPLSWGRAQASNDSLLRSCSQKLSILKKNKHTKKEKSIQVETRKKTQRTLDDEDSTPLFNGKKKVKLKTVRKTKKSGEQNLGQIMKISDDSKTETSGTVETFPSEDLRKSLDSSWPRGKKGAKQPVARSRFRKGGIVATATIHSYADAESDDNDNSLPNDNKKKKKKRKFIGMNRKVRKVMATTVAISQKP